MTDIQDPTDETASIICLGSNAPDETTSIICLGSNAPDETASIICLGSNAPDGEAKIRTALAMLQAKGCRVIAASPIYPSSHGYLNQVAAIDPGPYDRAVLTALTKWTERRLGRTPQTKAQGRIPIDIDIVIHRGRLLRPADYSSPYFLQGYTLLPIPLPKVYHHKP